MSKLKSVYYHLVWTIKGVQIFALIGRSGTGKSFRAQLIAQKYGIDFIVDDGLLIKDQNILAGKSAKKEKYRFTATKTAIFTDPAHAKEVKSALQSENFKRILIIGISEKMVRRIVQRLDLPHPHKIINIDEVSTQKEIEIARQARTSEGKHIIPVPSVEVKRNYPHIFFESVKIWIRKRLGMKRGDHMIEKTVVWPEFAGRGKVSIHERSLGQMVLHCVSEFDPTLRILKIIVKADRHRFGLEVILDVPYGTQIAGNIHTLRRYILENIERFTGLILEEVNITIGRVSKTVESGTGVAKANG